MRLSIVSGTYNRLTALQNMIQSARDTLPFGFALEIIIVDGGSTDGSLDWLRQQADVTLIEHGELRGAIPAFCDGAKAATGKYVVLANDDIIFKPGALLAGIVHLEETVRCGGVAYADNRPGAYNPQGRHIVQMMAAWRTYKGKFTRQDYRPVPYAQVGMFRKWLGDAVGWWGADDPAFPARTYGGDNYLSARIWELGYTIEAVPACTVDDLMIRDDLRELNNGPPSEKIGHTDTEAYYQRFPEGTPMLPNEMKIAQQDKRHLRILYLPIYEPGYAIQRQQKNGLRRALQKVGWVYEFDYLASTNLSGELLSILERFQPDMILSQLHGADRVTVQLARQVRQRFSRLLWVNWNGDYWPDSLIAPPMLDLLQYINLQLVVNASVLPTYQGRGIPAAYWQIGYEEPGNDLPAVPAHDVVFLGNAYHPQRQALEPVLRANNLNVGLYGDGWERAEGRCLYDFATGKALYRNAKLAIGDNMYPDAYGFVSNRLFQALAAGGALLLHQTVPGLHDLTGIMDGDHYVAWTDNTDLLDKMEYYLEHESERQAIAEAGTQLVREQHSFEARVYELFDRLLPLADKPLQNRVGLRYTGQQKQQFSVKGRTGQRYSCMPGVTLFVDLEDVDYIMRDGVWEKVGEIAPNDRLAEGVPTYGAQ